jgi:hypothetical protein
MEDMMLEEIDDFANEHNISMKAIFEKAQISVDENAYYRGFGKPSTVRDFFSG